MNPENRRKLEATVVSAAEAALATQRYVSAIDVLVGIGWLAPSHVKRWRTGQLAYLESSVQANLSRISEAIDGFAGLGGRRAACASAGGDVAVTAGRRRNRGHDLTVGRSRISRRAPPDHPAPPRAPAAREVPMARRTSLAVLFAASQPGSPGRHASRPLRARPLDA